MYDLRLPLSDDNATRGILEDVGTHTYLFPFCNITLHPDCPFREDETLIHMVNEQVQEGLLTPEEATRTIRGEML